MRYVDGCDLAELVRTVGPLSPARAVSLIEQAASALQTAHDAGLVHRDVKPSNLLIDRGATEAEDFLYLADFGIAKATGSTTHSHSLTRTGVPLGTLDYMAPEQFDGVAGPQTDVYALACVFYELLTGQKPYHGKSAAELMHAHLLVPPPRPSTARPSLHPALDEVVRRGMAKTAAERFTSAAELARSARAALDASGPATGVLRVGPETARELRAREAERMRELRRTDPLRRDTGRHQIEDVPGTEPEAGATTGGGLDDDRADGPTATTGADAARPRPDAPDDAPPERGAARTDAPAGRGRPARPPGDDGAAATADRGDTGEPATVSGPTLAGDTVVDPTEEIHNTTVDVPRPRSRRWQVLVVAAAIAGVVAVVGTVVTVVTRSSPSPAGGAGPTTVAASGSAAAAAPPAVHPSTSALTAVITITVGPTPQGIALSPDDRTAYVANSGANTVSVIDTAGNKVTGELTVPGVPHYVTVSKDGRRLFVAMWADHDSDSDVAVLDLPSGHLVTKLATGTRPYALATAPDGRIWVPNHESADIAVIDPDALTVIKTIPVSQNPHGVAFSPDGTVAYSADHESDQVSVIDTHELKVTTTWPGGNSPHSLAASPDGHTIAVADYGDGKVDFLSAATGAPVRDVPAGTGPQSLTYSADGKYVYVVDNGSDQVASLDAVTGHLDVQTTVRTSPRFVVASRDGTRLFVTDAPETEPGTVSVLSCAA